MKKPAEWPIFSFDFLLGAILALLLATPFLQDDHNPLLAGLLGLVLFSSAYATSYKRWHLVVSAGLGLPWLVITIVWGLTPESPVQLAGMSLFVLFAFYTSGVILGHVVRTKDVTRSLIAAGISVYFLLAIAWAVIFAIVEVITPGSIYFPEGTDALSFSSFLYFSIATITTVGYGDVYPVSDIARILAVLEGAAGFLFIGVFIARLISQFRN